MLRWTVLVCVLLCWTGCETGELRDELFGETDGGSGGFVGTVGNLEWVWPAEPGDFEATLVAALALDLQRLPSEGSADRRAWPASVWPSLHDSTNHRWLAGDLSPVEKYDLTYNAWSTTKNFEALSPFSPARCEERDFDPEYYEGLGPAAEWTARHRGNWAAHDKIDSDGDGHGDECDDLDGVDSGRDLDHAWAAAAMVETEPREPIEVAGVTFWPSDLKALLLTVYDDAAAYVLTGACQGQPLERRFDGVVSDAACEGMSAGDFHLVLTNLVGRFGMAIAEDVRDGEQVVSRPLDSYKVEVLRDVDSAEARELLGLDEAVDEKWELNPDARAFVEVQVTTTPLTAAEPSPSGLLDQVETYRTARGLHYILELDLDRRIIGGQWITSDKSGPVPGFLWIAQGPRLKRLVGQADTALDAPSNPFVHYEEVLSLAHAGPAVPETLSHE
jgi:hypothetical protein